MTRASALVMAGLLAFGCKKDAAHRPLVPPWQWVVTGTKPGNVAAEPALLVCDGDGGGCAPVKAGARLSGNKLLRLERGVSEFELDSATRVEVAEGSELLLEDAPRTLTVRSGGVVLSRTGEVAEAGPLIVKLIDRALELVGRTSLVARAENLNRGQLFVAQGVVKAKGPSDTRELHPGEGALFERQGALDFQALFAGKVSRFRQSVLAIAHPPPPASVTAPRGLGSMTARVPGTTAVVGGVRLAQHRVRALVRDGVAQTEIEEVFENEGDQVLEGRYVFPLPPDATISGLTLFVNDQPVEASLVEKKRAAAIFKGIVDDTVKPRDPALLEWVRGSEFSLKIFPIPARGRRKVVLRYQQALGSDGPSQAYVYPLSLGTERSTHIDELSIDVDLSDSGAAVKDVVVSGYPASVTSDARAVHVALRASKSAPQEDFSVSFRRASPGATVGTAEQGFVAVRLRAELPPESAAPAFRRRDRVVVVDASQSQSADSFAGARQLALGIVRSLEPDERFALLVCDSACESFPKSGLSSVAGGALGEAEGLLTQRKPSGASDLAGALRAAAERVGAGESVQVVYVGDGSPSAGELSPPRMAARVRPSFEARKVDLRLIGAGVSVDEVTLRALARELAGSYERVSSAGSLAERTEQLAAGLRTPLLIAPTLEVPAALGELEPRVLPSLRLGEELTVLAKYASNLPFNVTLRGTLDGKPYALVRAVPVQSSPASALPFVARSWADARIRELSTAGDPSSVAEQIELSKRFGVMSRETSWLVLENEQMFADFGIARPKLQVEQSASERAQLASELDQAETGGSGQSDESKAAPTPAPAAAGPAKRDAAKPSQAPPAAPVTPRPADAGGSLGGIGSTGRGEAGEATKVAGPRGNASIGGVSVSGGAVANAARVVAGMRAGFRSCYTRGLSEDPDAAGSVRLVLKLGSDGAVTNVTGSASGRVSSSIMSCVQARAKAAIFDKPEGGSASVALVATLVKLEGEAPSVTPPAPPIELPRDVATVRAGDENWTREGEPALAKLGAELSANPASRKRHEALVRALLLRGRFAPALAAAERFVEVDPELALARELLAYARVANGDRAGAATALAGIVENAASDAKAQGRAARAFEALGDEARACAHWRSLFELLPDSAAARFEALRCRARVLGDRDAAVTDARAVARPDGALQKLLPLLESGPLPAFATSTGSAGQFEVQLSCEPAGDCPLPLVVTPTGTVLSPSTPGLGRSSALSFAFSGLLTGSYRVLLVGGAATAKGQLQVRALNARNSFAFAPGHGRTIANVQVSLAPAGGLRRF